MMIASLRHNTRLLCLTAALCAVAGLAGCKTVGEIWRHEAANRLAVPAHLLKRQIAAGPYHIAVFERVRERGQPVTLYIEGDGEFRHNDVTPDYPLALHLATRDLGDNVIVVARPCQYTGADGDNPPCTRDYWMNSRFSLETMEAMNTVLEKLKNRHSFTGFHLVGYDGGGTVAALLAAKRDDVLSLRTVAANLDTDLNNANNKLEPMASSLNPRDFAVDIAAIPQHHFIGEWDKKLSPAVTQSFRNAMGPSPCVRVSTVAEVDHKGGWANRWPSLLAMPVDCNLAP